MYDLTRRGNPDKGDVIHYLDPNKTKLDALCSNGSYHLYLTSAPQKVTCNACKNHTLWDIYKHWEFINFENQKDNEI